VANNIIDRRTFVKLIEPTSASSLTIGVLLFIDVEFIRFTVAPYFFGDDDVNGAGFGDTPPNGFRTILRDFKYDHV
jgi:hypothetical protein